MTGMLTEWYDRETNRRAREPKPAAPRNSGMVHTNPETGIMAQLQRAAGRVVADGVDSAAEPGERRDREAVKFADRRPANPGTGTVELARPGQIGLVYVLLKKLATHNPTVERTARAWFENNKATISKANISDVIDRLKGHLSRPADTPPDATPAPVKSNVWAEWRQLAEHLVSFGGNHGARFAVDTEDGATNSIAFWWIVPGRDGRYFLRQMIGGHDEPVRVRMAPEAMVGVAKKIMTAGPKEAMLRYGQELGSCGHCGRTLTNDESRARGIGPVCAKSKGWG